PVEYAASANPLRLHRSLFMLREAVRERLPAAVMSHDDREGLGFETVLAVDERSFYVQGWLQDEGRAQRLTAVAPEGPAVAIRDPVELRDTILADLAREPPSEQALLLEHVHPAIGKLQARTETEGKIARLVELGTRARAPVASIVVPLYRRIDFLEHQLAQF